VLCGQQLALKLHPDKNKAPKAEEAFKAVSKAFSCLSDADKRAYYDATGYESSGAAAAASRGQPRARGGGGGGGFGPGGMYYGEDFDPEEIFNVFFGWVPALVNLPVGPIIGLIVAVYQSLPVVGVSSQRCRLKAALV
jgi:DnaJ-class molecular chaperone